MILPQTLIRYICDAKFSKTNSGHSTYSRTLFIKQKFSVKMLTQNLTQSDSIGTQK